MSKKALPKKPLTKRRLKNLILNVVKNPFNMIVLISLIILFCLIIIPLLTMIATTFTAALFCFNTLPVPLSVPPVPTEATNISTFPSVSAIISFAVVSS